MIRSRRLHHAALLLALFGVLLRGAIPAGFMPAFGDEAHHGAWLALCSSGELHQLPAGWHSGLPTTPHDDAGHALQMQQECPYAAAASQTLPARAPQFATGGVRAQLVARYAAAAPLPRQLADLPPVRGPPALS